MGKSFGKKVGSIFLVLFLVLFLVGSVSAAAAKVSSVSIASADGFYNEGDVIQIAVDYNIPVDVGTTGGTPYITLNTTPEQHATYVTAANPQSQVIFSYTVQSGDNDANLGAATPLSDSIVLNGGTIRNETTDANNTLPNNFARNVVIDTTAPTISGIDMNDSALKIGDVALVTFNFDEPVLGFGNSDVTTIANGTLTTVASDDGNVTWTAVFTPDSSIQDTSNVITVTNTGLTDTNGNAGASTTSSENYVVDTVRPTVSSITLSDSALKFGETATVTITFNEAVLDFNNVDVNLAVANGTLSAVTSEDGNVTWTATFTPSTNTESATNTIYVVKTGLTDTNGNAGVGSTPNAVNYAIDTIKPTIVSASVNQSDPVTYGVNGVTQVTLVFSEDLNENVALDVNITGLTGGTYVVTRDEFDSNTWVGYFTLDDNNEKRTALIHVALAQDLAGNVITDVNADSFEVNTIYEFEFPKAGTGFRVLPRFGDLISKYDLNAMSLWDADLDLNVFIASNAGSAAERLTTSDVANVYIYNDTNGWITVPNEDFSEYNLFSQLASLNYFVFDLEDSAIGLSIRHENPKTYLVGAD